MPDSPQGGPVGGSIEGIKGKDMQILKLVLSKESDIIPMLKVQMPRLNTGSILSPKN